LKEAFATNDAEKLIRYVRLHSVTATTPGAARKSTRRGSRPAALDRGATTDREFILETLAANEPATLAHLFFHCTFTSFSAQESGFMTVSSDESKQLRPGLWATINERYRRSMITKDDFVPLAPLAKAAVRMPADLRQLRCVQPKGTMPFDVVHPVGDYSFRRVPSTSRPTDLEIHQDQVSHHGAMRDLNVIFPIERLQELAADRVIGGLTASFFSFIGYTWIRTDWRPPWRKKLPVPSQRTVPTLPAVSC